MPKIDLLKIDIEGAEKEVFENNDSWIAKVWMVLAELHDRIKPGCESAFENATKEFSKKWIMGEHNCASRE